MTSQHASWESAASRRVGKWSYHVLVFNLTEESLFWLADFPQPQPVTAPSVPFAALYASDRRSGAAETTI